MRHKRCLPHLSSIGDRIYRRQPQCAKDRHIRRQHGFQWSIVCTLPRKTLLLFSMWLAAPFGYPKEMQAHCRMRIGEYLSKPRKSRDDVDAHFFMQLTRETLQRALTGLYLATRKFPIACIDFTFRPFG